MKEKINKLLAKSVIIQNTFDNNKIDYDDVSIDDNPDLLEGIKLLLEEDEEFFLLSHVSDFNFIETTYLLVNEYRNLPNRNTKLINDIIGKLNMLGIADVNLEKVDNYFDKDLSSRGILYDNLEDAAYCMMYDAVIYNALKNSRFDIDNYNAILSSINYFYNNIPEMFKNKEIYQNTIIMLENTINKSFPLTTRRKTAKFTKKNLETLRIQE
ncbi:MAG: hypothetical protein E7160_01205 [Firmicutes bacterium]|nr:hypothetical protein [Bacillota bacterium]